jgi:hypothetical protein
MYPTKLVKQILKTKAMVDQFQNWEMDVSGDPSGVDWNLRTVFNASLSQVRGGLTQ